jgi:glycosyltransferase involved in cell wall biosynthesis
MDLTVVIPTRDRRAILCETLTRLDRGGGEVRFEVIVVDDGSVDGTQAAVRALGLDLSLDLTLLEQRRRGAAAARNRALAAARGPVCLFLNDDSWPEPDLVARHAAFHARHPEAEAALVGGIGLPSEPPPTPFMHWLVGVHFDYDVISDPGDAGGGCFFTANVSAKTRFLRDAGAFDESFPDAAYEDIELGLRLEGRGLRLAYDEHAVVEHCHPLDLPTAVARMYRMGERLPLLVERHPDWPIPRRPGARHRVKAAALTALTLAGARTPRLKHEVWRFLCHEAVREGYWSAVAGRRDEPIRSPTPRIGAGLARVAARDEDAKLPNGLDRAAQLQR